MPFLALLAGELEEMGFGTAFITSGEVCAGAGCIRTGLAVFFGQRPQLGLSARITARRALPLRERRLSV